MVPMIQRRLHPGLRASQEKARIRVRELTRDDESEFVERARQSLEFHQEWIKVPTDPEAFCRYLDKFDGDDATCFVVCDQDTDTIVGFVSLTGIEREPYHRGRLGYGVFRPYVRMGYTQAALEYVIRHAFEDIGLHRLEADIQPENDASKQLIMKMGFSCEGISPGFIQIKGNWRDHERWALTVDNWPQRQSWTHSRA
jgi:ribosomal-protein-alanine N-acetyltransferase